jgi:hypothetical protein
MIDFRRIHRAPPVQMRALMGLGDASTILGQESSDTSGYQDSPAFLESQATALQAECAAAPNGPACLDAQATGDITSGYNPVADTDVDLNDYCQQNVANNAVFNTPLDTSTCAGSAPLASVVAQAAAIPSSNGWIGLTPAQIASVPAPVVTPTPNGSAVTPTGVTPVVAVAAVVPPAASTSASGLSITPSASTVTTSTSTFALPAWLTEDSYAGIQNWIWIAGGLVALMVLPSLLKRGR